ncbi:MAG TPA: BadF/BadG/BcrA/BcrD ATPase family protein [Lacisediminihabitans sp.]|uniref:N-acetylglucosamine kinase n=1 Tax=Lacisediminihabitans sp. TaxID=2787631 RepID=UPI002EDABCF0
MLLAIDGGGTKTHGLLFDAYGVVHAVARGPRCLPQVDGVADALGVLDSLVARLLADGGATAADVHHAGVYLTGMDLPQEEERFAVQLRTREWARSFTLANDTFALLRAGTDAPDAIAIVCGTGLNCVGTSASGSVTRFPALGRLSGDWGGGTDLAEEILWSAARAEDGRGPDTLLRSVVTEIFGTHTVYEAYCGLHLGEIDPAIVAELPPGLFAAAEAGDAVALAVVHRQAEEIVALGRVAMQRLGLTAVPIPVVLGGSVLAAGHPTLVEPVERGLRSVNPAIEVRMVGRPPVVGAAILVLEQVLGGEADVEPAAGALILALADQLIG